MNDLLLFIDEGEGEGTPPFMAALALDDNHFKLAAAGLLFIELEEGEKDVCIALDILSIINIFNISFLSSIKNFYLLVRLMHLPYFPQRYHWQYELLFYEHDQYD